MNEIITRWLNYWSYKRAKKSADKLSRMYNRKYVVFFWRGQFKAIPQTLLKQMYHAGQFKKGINLRQLKNMAVYSTH